MKSHESRARSGNIIGALAGAAAVVLCVLPLYVTVIPPMADLPAHVLIARVLAQYGDPVLRYADYFTIQWTVAPTSLFYLVFVRLQEWFGPYWDARVYLTIWAALTWASVWSLAAALRQREPWLHALVAMPLAFCWYTYNGFLPFLMSLPLFAFAVAAWLSDWRLAIKIPLLWALLAGVFGFHIVGAAAAAATVVIAAVVQVVILREDRRQLLWAGLSVAPLGVMTLAYLGGQAGPRATVRYESALDQIVDVVKFTCASLSDGAGLLMLAWLGALGLVLLFKRRDLMAARATVIAAAFLLVLAVAMPVSLSALYPAGPRLLPFALMLLIASVRWADLNRMRVALACGALITALSLLTMRHAMELDPGYRDVLDAAEMVAPGKRLLPIMADQYAGSRWTKPYLHVEALVTIARGGSNPYVFAAPHILTAASPITFRHESDARRFAFFYDEDRGPEDYAGISGYYDYVFIWGRAPAITHVIEREMTRVYARGNVTLFARDTRTQARASVEDTP